MNQFEKDIEKKRKHFLSIPKNYLVLIAGLLWMFAGVMVVFTGLPIFVTMLTPTHLIFSLATFLIFYFFIFSNIVHKHTRRIKLLPQAYIPFWHFFDTSSYVIMAVMMIGGFSLRKFEILPLWFIGPFYTGLGIALFICGVRFLLVFFKKSVLKP